MWLGASANPLVMHSRLTQHVYIELLASRYKNAWAMSEEALALSRTLGDGYMFMVGHYYAGLACCIWASGESCGRSRRRASGRSNPTTQVCRFVCITKF